MSDYNTQALNYYQAEEDMKDAKDKYEEECIHRAYLYYKGQIAKVDGANLETHFFSTGGRSTYCFNELMFDELGAKNNDLDRLFAAMLETEAGAKFKEELARVLSVKYSEVGEIDSD